VLSSSQQSYCGEKVFTYICFVTIFRGTINNPNNTMAEVVTTNSEEFKNEIESNEGLVLVDFYADWCGPCKQLGPVLDKVAEKYDGKVKVLKVNVDKNQKLALEYKVKSIPQMFVLKGGETVESMVGLQTENSISSKLNTLLS